MELADFLADPANAHTAQGNPVVACNALYKTADTVNCYLTPTQAIALAQNLLQKAQVILVAGLEGTAVQVWNKGAANEKLYCGLVQARKGPRKGGKKPPAASSNGQS